MFSRSLARHSMSPLPFALALAVATSLIPSTSSEAARIHFHAGVVSHDEHESQVAGAGTVEGDIWGGEQITTPAPGGTFRDDPQPTFVLREPESPAPWVRWWNRIVTHLFRFSR